MNYTGHSRLRLISRNEGKLKSYESCGDVRAWSHDVVARDRYLREWIKRDMPICVISVSTLANFLRTMTCKNRGRATPRCHPNCKSKVVLDSICISCHAMKQCLKNGENFGKYFDEEELETGHWPCERCLDAFKSIKMFWKIIIEKIFNLNLSKNRDLLHNRNHNADSVRSVAKAWQSEMVHQALFVKNVSPIGGRCQCRQKGVKTTSNTFNRPEQVLPPSVISSRPIHRCKARDEQRPHLGLMKMNPKSICKVVNRSISVRSKMVDVSSEACEIQKESEEFKVCKRNLDIVQQQLNVQNDEVERLRKENVSLKIELQKFYKSFSIKTPYSTPSKLTSGNEAYLIPKPFEICEESVSEEGAVHGIDSEMIITLKNCANPNFRHVSVLQVLHKTNDLTRNNINAESGCRKEDPIQVLAKMHDTFGAIVKREINIVKEKRRSRTKISDIDASFHRVNASRSVPSCSTLGSNSTSQLHCACMKNEREKHGLLKKP